MPMSLAASEYRAPWWLPGGHLQTIVPAELFPKAKVIYRREIWNTPDDDIIAVDWSTPEPIDPKAPIMVHIHGLEGSSNSHYARALMARCGQGGVRGVVIHYRGCGGVTNKKLRAYNAADAAELDWEFARLRELYPEAPIYAMGVSPTICSSGPVPEARTLQNWFQASLQSARPSIWWVQATLSAKDSAGFTT